MVKRSAAMPDARVPWFPRSGTMFESVYDSCPKYAIALTFVAQPVPMQSGSLLPLPLDLRGTDGHNHSVVRLTKKSAAGEAGSGS